METIDLTGKGVDLAEYIALGFCTLFTIEEFNLLVDQGMITDDDGSGYMAVGTIEYPVDPFRSNWPEEPKFTHVIWYNK